MKYINNVLSNQAETETAVSTPVFQGQEENIFAEAKALLSSILFNLYLSGSKQSKQR